MPLVWNALVLALGGSAFLFILAASLVGVWGDDL